MSDRGVAPVVGVVLLVGIALLLAGTVAVGVLQFDLSSPPPQASFEGTIDHEDGLIDLVHTGGDPVSVERIDLRVRVDGTPLEKQPPVPFFAAPGFEGGPTGPINPATSNRWHSGERSTFRVASTNDPYPTETNRTVVEIHHENGKIATIRLTSR